MIMILVCVGVATNLNLFRRRHEEHGVIVTSLVQTIREDLKYISRQLAKMLMRFKPLEARR